MLVCCYGVVVCFVGFVFVLVCVCVVVGLDWCVVGDCFGVGVVV